MGAGTYTDPAAHDHHEAPPTQWVISTEHDEGQLLGPYLSTEEDVVLYDNGNGISAVPVDCVKIINDDDPWFGV